MFSPQAITFFGPSPSGREGPMKLPRSVYQYVIGSVGQLSVFLRNGSWDFSKILHEVRGS